jgi:hypothetical protein
VKLYWTGGQIPELKGWSAEVREELVEAALFSIPATLRNFGIVCGVLVPLVAVGLLLAELVGWWVPYVWLPLGLPVIWVTLLNLAIPGMREIINSEGFAASLGDRDR